MNTSTDPRIAALEARKAQLDARLAAARARQARIAKSLDTRRKILVGAAVLRARADDASLADWLAERLDRFLQRPADREVCRDLLSLQTHPQDQREQIPPTSAAG